MKKLLFLTPQLPFPAFSGGAIKSLKMVDHLAKNYDLTVISLLKEGDDKNVDAFLKACPVKSFHGLPISVPRNLLNFIKSISHGIPLTIYRNRSHSALHLVESIADQFDCIIADHYLMFQYIPTSYKGRVLLHQHNAEYVMWERMADQENSPLKRALISFEAKRIKKYEIGICSWATAVIAAPNDIEKLVEIGIKREKTFLTYHLGPDESNSSEDIDFSSCEHALLYVGTLTWEANVDGLLWFIDKVLPQVKKVYPNIKLYIVGKNPDSRLLDAASGNSSITLTGFVEDLEPYFNRARLFIAPLLFGSGMKVKVISAMGRGIPVVTTSVGAEGIEAIDMEHLALSDTPDGMAKKIIQLLPDIEKLNEISIKSRALINKKYTWDNVYSLLEDAIHG